MSTYSFDDLQGAGTGSQDLTAGTPYTFNLTNNSGSSYFTMETPRNFDGVTPRNLSGSITSASSGVVFNQSDYIAGFALPTGNNSFVFTPSTNVTGSTLKLRGTGGIYVELSGSGGVAYILDTYSAEGAYSMRKISSTATNCIRVRRSDNNAEQDIGFVGDELDTTALLSFVGANDGFVTTWYDQSGNSRDAVNTTANTQPRIVLGGVLETKNTKPAIYFNNDWLKYLGQVVPLATNPFSCFTVSSHETANDIGVVFKSYDRAQAGGSDYVANFHDRRTNKVNFLIRASGATYRADLSVQRDNSDYTLLSGFVDGSNNMSAFDNGDTGTTDTYSGTYISNAFMIGDSTTGSDSFQLVGHIGEVIILNTDESANRVAIETDINNYYTVF